MPGGGQDPNLHFVSAAGSFAAVDGSAMGDLLTGASNATLSGGQGSDQYFVPAQATVQNLRIVDEFARETPQEQPTR